MKYQWLSAKCSDGLNPAACKRNLEGPKYHLRLPRTIGTCAPLGPDLEGARRNVDREIVTAVRHKYCLCLKRGGLLTCASHDANGMIVCTL